MFQTHLRRFVVFGLILKSRRDLEDRIEASTFYIGLGDQFDDDRRVVREGVSASRSAIRSPLADSLRD